MAYWEIDFSVFAPVTFEQHISFKAEKGTTLSSFYSKIDLSRKPFGFNATVIAAAPDKVGAKIAGRVFFEGMLNILSFELNEPMFIYEDNIKIKTPNYTERLIIKKKNFENAFEIARKFEKYESSISNALSWYSKAINSNNVIDEFLYLYNVLEILATTYTTINDHTRGNFTKNKIFQVFLDYGLEENTGEMPAWINDMNDVRLKIAHGTEPIDYKRVIRISKKLALLKCNARKILEKIIESRKQIIDDTNE